MKALYALYSDPDAAQFAVNSLKLAGGSLGITESQIAVVSSEPFDGYDFSDEHSQNAHLPHCLARRNMRCAFGSSVRSLHSVRLSLAHWRHAHRSPLDQRHHHLRNHHARCHPNHRRHPAGHRPACRTSASASPIPEIWQGKILVGVTDPPDKARPEIEKQLRLAGASQVKTV